MCKPSRLASPSTCATLPHKLTWPRWRSSPWKPIQQLPVTRSASLSLGPFLSLHYPSHERGNRPRTVVLLNRDMKVSSRLFLSLGRLPKRISDRLPIIPIRKISLTYFLAHEKKLVFSVFNLGLLLDDRHETLLIIETISLKVPDFIGSPLDRMDQRKRTACKLACATHTLL
ncbi:hypothetical protein Cgig2_010026 [Carnegiea gigantea]|uniref:Uncharacterized protein n=1 Tax=Carnegiea gigantea TaxID=171969 RepID=A0A9Q1K3D4_9CARY|nr:hypothetical protein Cgig2_010026 [Carnegiea gigantea]